MQCEHFLKLSLTAAAQRGFAEWRGREQVTCGVDAGLGSEVGRGKEASQQGSDMQETLMTWRLRDSEGENFAPGLQNC